MTKKARNNKKYQTINFRHIVQLSAPHSFAASLCPALFGVFFCLLKGLPLKEYQAIGLVIACLLMQAAVNTFNDLIDYIKGTDSQADHLEKSDATLVYERLNPRHVLAVAMGELLLGALIGVLCSLHWLPILIGVIGGIVVIIYSGGPFPLSYYPIGELVSGVVMGGMIPFGVAAATDGRAHWDALLFSIPLIISIGLIMMSNNGSDIEKDQTAGRKTLPIVLGRPRTVILFRILLALWLLMIAVGPVIFLGWIGLLSPVLIAIFVRKPLLFLFRANLAPEHRILQMKSISIANLLGNGAMILSMVAAWIIRLLASS